MASPRRSGLLKRVEMTMPQRWRNSSTSRLSYLYIEISSNLSLPRRRFSRRNVFYPFHPARLTTSSSTLPFALEKISSPSSSDSITESSVPSLAPAASARSASRAPRSKFIRFHTPLRDGDENWQDLRVKPSPPTLNIYHRVCPVGVAISKDIRFIRADGVLADWTPPPSLRGLRVT